MSLIGEPPLPARRRGRALADRCRSKRSARRSRSAPEDLTSSWSLAAPRRRAWRRPSRRMAARSATSTRRQARASRLGHRRGARPRPRDPRSPGRTGVRRAGRDEHGPPRERARPDRALGRRRRSRRRIDVDEIEELTADTSERAGWTLGDAVVARDAGEAVVAADALLAQGEDVTPLIYGIARAPAQTPTLRPRPRGRRAGAAGRGAPADGALPGEDARPLGPRRRPRRARGRDRRGRRPRVVDPRRIRLRRRGRADPCGPAGGGGAEA